MPRSSQHDILFEPIAIGPKVMKNRFYQVPQCTGAGSDQPGLQQGHRRIKAEGGWGAICTEYCSISPESDATDKVSVRLWDETDVQNLRPTTEVIHAHGALAGVELWYGSDATSLESRTPVRGPSGWGTHGAITTYTRYMDLDDIQLVQSYYVDAALLARDAGFDIVYIYGSRSQVPMQFLSKWWNDRTDSYGGSFVNRARFWRETLERVREAVGDDCAIAARFSVDQLKGPSAIEVHDEGARFVEHVDHLVDLWDVLIGHPSEAGQNITVSRFFAQNTEAPYTSQLKLQNHTNKAVVGVGRLTDADAMAHMITSGQLDIIGAARPSIADPFLPAKIDAGRLDEIRECIGCNICISRWELGGAPVVCTQNATAGEEYRRGWHPERFAPARNRDKGVLVVGAGPAGMECAVVLGKRKMNAVNLVDAGSELGGSLRWMSKLGHVEASGHGRERARGLGEWQRVTDYRKIQLAKLRNVEVHLGTSLTAADVLSYGAELVVIATGCHFSPNGTNPVTHAPIPGADTSLDWQFTPDQVITQHGKLGERVLVFETEGNIVGIAVAEKLAGEGKQVQLVTHQATFGAYMQYTLETPMSMRALHRLDVSLHPYTMLTQITPGTCHLCNVWNEDERYVVEVDSVVLATHRVPDRDLFDQLKQDPARLEAEGVESVFLIGDASAPRLVVDAVFDGHRLAREIDSPNPAIPLPYIRERRLWGPVTNDTYDDQIRQAVVEA